MTSISGAERLPDGDYSVSHRAPPPIPSATSSSDLSSAVPNSAHSTAHNSASHGYHSKQSSYSDTHFHGRRGTSQDSTVASNPAYRISNSSTGSTGSHRRIRDGSFSILRRGTNKSSHSPTRNIAISSPTLIAPVEEDPLVPSATSAHVPPAPTQSPPPLPYEHQQQGQPQQQSQPQQAQQSQPQQQPQVVPDRSISQASNRSHEDGNMFRSRSSTKRQQEAEPVSRERQFSPQRPTAAPHNPRLPPHHPLSTIHSFSGIPEEDRPDSIALFNHNAYVASPISPTQNNFGPLPPHPRSPPPLPPPPIPSSIASAFPAAPTGIPSGPPPPPPQVPPRAPYPTQLPPPPPPPVAANFSRPGMPVSAYANNTPQNSSSPAYAIRQGNAFAAAASSPISPPPVTGYPTTNGEYVGDDQSSVATRSRVGSVSTVNTINVNSPRRVRRRKDPIAFNILVIGAKNSGKTSFINFLRHSLVSKSKKSSHSTEPIAEEGSTTKSSFTSSYLETDLDGERVALTFWDSAGLEKSVVDLQLREMTNFVESKFEETFAEEQKVNRTPGVKDTHIHLTFLLLEPSRLDLNMATSRSAQTSPGGLIREMALDTDMDMQILRALWGKTAVIPIVTKADTVTSSHMNYLKRAVWDNMKIAKLDPLEALVDDEEEEEDSSESEPGTFLNERDEDDADDDVNQLPQSRSKSRLDNTNVRQSSIMASMPYIGDGETPLIPMSVLSPDPSELQLQVPGAKVGRRFPWGFADPNDPEHCDFPRVKETFFSEWRTDLREIARNKWYENWRTSRLKSMPASRHRERITSATSAGSSNPSIPRDSQSRGGSTMSPSMSPRNFNQGEFGSNIHTAGVAMAPAVVSTVPRTVMNGAAPPNLGNGAQGHPSALSAFPPMRNTSKAERMMGMTPAQAKYMREQGQGPVQENGQGGTYRDIETYRQ